ncbi:MAG: hypothetical protein ABIH59_03545 [archaeon]
MNKWVEILTGLILLIGIILVAWYSALNNWELFGKSFNFLHPAWIILKGFIFWIIAMIGLFLIFLGISDLKN